MVFQPIDTNGSDFILFRKMYSTITPPENSHGNVELCGTQRDLSTGWGRLLFNKDILSTVFYDAIWNSKNPKNWLHTTQYANQQLLVDTLKNLELSLNENTASKQITSLVTTFCLSVLTSKTWEYIFDGNGELELPKDMNECQGILNSYHFEYIKPPEIDFVKNPLLDAVILARRILLSDLQKKYSMTNAEQSEIYLTSKELIDKINSIYQSCISGDLCKEQNLNINNLLEIEKTVQCATKALRREQLQLQFDNETTPPLDCFATRLSLILSRKLPEESQDGQRVICEVNRLLLKTLPIREKMGPEIHFKEQREWFPGCRIITLW